MYTDKCSVSFSSLATIGSFVQYKMCNMGIARKSKFSIRLQIEYDRDGTNKSQLKKFRLPSNRDSPRFMLVTVLESVFENIKSIKLRYCKQCDIEAFRLLAYSSDRSKLI